MRQKPTRGEAARVDLSVYDTAGRLVERLVNRRQAGGAYEVKWNAAGQASGVYLIVLSVNENTSVRKSVYLK